jgi:hypothetical protein
MIRKGSLVRFDVDKVSSHPVYNKLTDKRFKVTGISDNRADVGGGVMLPVGVLIGIPQKKGKKVA